MFFEKLGLEKTKKVQRNIPTATIPDSKFPDISLQILFSISRPHICWYSWKTDKEKETQVRKILIFEILGEKEGQHVQLLHWGSRIRSTVLEY